MTDDATPRPTARRPGGRTAHVRAQILAATAELVARQGLAGFGYEDVAELAGVSRTSVYRNWPDRDTLVSEAILRNAAGMVSVADTGDLRADLVEFLVTLGESLHSPHGRALLQAARAARENPETRRTVTEIFQQRTTVVQERLDSAVERGELPPVDGYLLAQMLAGPVHSYADQGLRPFTRVEAERITDVVLAGIRNLDH